MEYEHEQEKAADTTDGDNDTEGSDEVEDKLERLIEDGWICVCYFSRLLLRPSGT